jgi:hypothetical protein
LESPVNAHLIEALTHTKNLQRAWRLVDKTITVIIELITELPAIYIPSDRSVVRVLEDTRRRTDHPTPSTYTTLIISGRPFIDHSIPVIVLFITDLYRCGDTFTSSEFSPHYFALTEEPRSTGSSTGLTAILRDILAAAIERKFINRVDDTIIISVE